MQENLLVDITIGQRTDGQWLVSVTLNTAKKRLAWASVMTEGEARVLAETFIQGGLPALSLYLKERWRGHDKNLSDLGLE